MRETLGGRRSISMVEESRTPVQVPQLSDVELAEQSAKLDALAEKWRKRQQALEEESSSRIGWVAASETINGRFAMFFVLVGLVTEYYTGESLPQQCYTLFQTLGFVDVSSPLPNFA